MNNELTINLLREQIENIRSELNDLSLQLLYSREPPNEELIEKSKVLDLLVNKYTKLSIENK
jgi:hypothetical protein